MKNTAIEESEKHLSDRQMFFLVRLAAHVSNG